MGLKAGFDPNSKASAKDGIYGLPFKEKDAKVVYIPVPWDVTTSYQAGTAKGPKAILAASEQIDFFDLDYVDAYRVGLFLQKEKAEIKRMNNEGRKLATKIIDSDEDKLAKDKTLQTTLKKVNALCEKLNTIVYNETKRLLDLDKMPVLIGGDHATPFGAIKAYSEKYKDLGILHFDAHSDTRIAYMGFENSHASIMYNVVEKISGVKKLVQIGIRDFCEQEYDYVTTNKKIKTYFDADIQKRKVSGENFAKIAKEVVSNLPKNVYISFDIDGLDPRYCPNTGTPVPGGIEYAELLALVNEVVSSGRKLVGFDLVEVAPGKSDEWDANVGMRLLYKITGAALASQGIIKKR